MHGGLVEPEKRPLNTYAPSFVVFHCPADKGDSLHTDKFPKKIRSCYDGWGNSYLTVWSVETLRIQHVTGDSNYDLSSSRRPMKSSEMSRSPSNKLVTGDWPWWADRKKKRTPGASGTTTTTSIDSTCCSATVTPSFSSFPRRRTTGTTPARNRIPVTGGGDLGQAESDQFADRLVAVGDVVRPAGEVGQRSCVGVDADMIVQRR